MPIPQFEPYVPKKEDSLEGRIKGMTNSYFEMVGNLNWLMQHLDEQNVIRAKSVIANWIYAGNIIADQIKTGTLAAININGVSISGSNFYGGNITVQQDININPVNAGGINFGYASVKFVPQYDSIEISGLGGVNITPFLSYNSQEVATQSWVTANFVHK
jgi:hypothetical protein